MCWFNAEEVVHFPRVPLSEFSCALKTYDPPLQSGLIPKTLRVRWCTSTTGREWKTSFFPHTILRWATRVSHCMLALMPLQSPQFGFERTNTAHSTVIVIKTAGSQKVLLVWRQNRATSQRPLSGAFVIQTFMSPRNVRAM